MRASLTWGGMLPDAYRRVLGAPGVAAPLAGVTISRLAIAAQPLATILLVKGSTGSFAAAGLVLACYSLAAAGSLPVQGRVIDRIGQTSVILVVTVVNAVAFGALIPLAAADAPVAAMAVAGLIAGLTTPPLGSSMRSLWAGLVPRPELRQAAFTVDAVAIDVAWILGPSDRRGGDRGRLARRPRWASASASACSASAVFAGVARRRARGEGLRRTSDSRVRCAPRRSGADGRGARRRDHGRGHRALDHGLRVRPRSRRAGRNAGRHPGRRQRRGRPLVRGASTGEGPPGDRLPAISLVFALSVVPLVAVPSVGAAFPLMALSGIALAPDHLGDLPAARFPGAHREPRSRPPAGC